MNEAVVIKVLATEAILIPVCIICIMKTLECYAWALSDKYNGIESLAQHTFWFGLFVSCITLIAIIGTPIECHMKGLL